METDRINFKDWNNKIEETEESKTKKIFYIFLSLIILFISLILLFTFIYHKRFKKDS